MEKKWVVFDLGGETFGIEIAVVESIVKMQAITTIPHAPDYVEGVTNLRGSVVPVIDLRKRLDVTGQANGRETRIIIANLGDVKTGMIVDAVSEVLNIDEDAVEPTPSIACSVDTQFITAIARLEQRLIILLDLEKILTIEEQQATRLLVDKTD